MCLIKYELKKIFQAPIFWISITAAIIINIFLIYSGENMNTIRALKENGSRLAGAITNQWTEQIQKETEAILENPDYQVSRSEADLIIQTYTEKYGYTKDAVLNKRYLFLNEHGLFEYNKYEDASVAANFYTNAEFFGRKMADYFQKTYPGQKGQCLAEDTLARYCRLSTGYTANYNYSYGYQKLRSIIALYPYTTGLSVLVALSPLFSAEYARKTAALILTQKNGRKKIIFTKLAAGITAALFLWLLMTALMVCLVFSYFGTAGHEAFWQNWITDTSPFMWNQGQITIISLLTSLLGTLYFTFVLILISSASKNQFITAILGAFILLVPVLDFGFTNYRFLRLFYSFFPSRLMSGTALWQNFDLFYFAGNTVPYQYVVIVFSVIISAAAVLITVRLFSSYQVKTG